MEEAAALTAARQAYWDQHEADAIAGGADPASLTYAVSDPEASLTRYSRSFSDDSASAVVAPHQFCSHCQELIASSVGNPEWSEHVPDELPLNSACVFCAYETFEIGQFMDGTGLRKPRKHHRNYVELEKSALAGCHLCSRFMSKIDTQNFTREAHPLAELDTLAEHRQLYTFICPHWKQDFWHSTESPESDGSSAASKYCGITYLVLFEAHESMTHLTSRHVFGCFPIERHPTGAGFQSCRQHQDLERSAPAERYKWATTTDTAEGYAMLSNWLERCVYLHDACRWKMDDKKPARLLDLNATLSNGDIRLVLTQDIGDEKYATLSYSWGKAQPVTLSHENYEELRASIRLAALPKTIQQAIKVCRSLSLRYLWVDALCIIQGDSKDFEHEISQMGSIYAGSFVTLAATDSVDCESGLFRGRWHPLWREECILKSTSKLTFSIPQDGSISHMDSRDHDTSVAESNLSSRAWVFQERMMAPRTIHFMNKELIWECRQLIQCYSCSDRWVDGDPIQQAPSCRRVRPDSRVESLDLIKQPEGVHKHKEADQARKIGQTGETGQLPALRQTEDFEQPEEANHLEGGTSSLSNQSNSSGHIAKEDMDKEDGRLPGLVRSDPYGFKALFNEMSRGRTAENEFNFQNLWAQVLEGYTETYLTKENDRLSALAGVAQLIRLEYSYEASWGLWLHVFLEELLWNSNGSRDNWTVFHESEASQGPSWSWTSATSHYHNRHIHNSRQFEGVEEIYRAVITKLPQATTFGQIHELLPNVQEGLMKIRGQAAKARCIPWHWAQGEKENFSVEFDYILVSSRESPTEQEKLAWRKSEGEDPVDCYAGYIREQDAAVVTDLRSDPNLITRFFADNMMDRNDNISCLLMKREVWIKNETPAILCVRDTGLVLRHVRDIDPDWEGDWYQRVGIFEEISSEPLDHIKTVRDYRQWSDEQEQGEIYYTPPVEYTDAEKEEMVRMRLEMIGRHKLFSDEIAEIEVTIG